MQLLDIYHCLNMVHNQLPEENSETSLDEASKEKRILYWHLWYTCFNWTPLQSLAYQKSTLMTII